MTEYDPQVRDFMKTAAQLLRKGARKKDPALMWAILVNLDGVMESFIAAAEEQYLVTKLNKEIEQREKQETRFTRIER
jgi:hypothetical protein